MELSPGARPHSVRLRQLDVHSQPVGEYVILAFDPNADRLDLQLLDADGEPFRYGGRIVELHAPAEPVRVAGRDEHGSPGLSGPGGPVG